MTWPSCGWNRYAGTASQQGDVLGHRPTQRTDVDDVTVDARDLRDGLGADASTEAPTVDPAPRRA